MFTRIARRYDLMNGLMTFGRHQAWRRAAARATLPAPEGPALDIATGTGDLALAVAAASPHRHVVGVDFSAGMLQQARPKLAARPEAHVSLVTADALALPFPDGIFACVTSAFLLRNLADPARGLTEMRRVTRPGGRVVVLEITKPTLPGFAPIFGLYFRRLVPLLGAIVAGDREAYTYLPDSVAGFLSPEALAQMMHKAGFEHVSYRRLAMGTVAIHAGVA
jgi:demethylmenaquinone methyltransferase/2-methoxy-6-polyprenyl-1,4-benzoquinol methylase